MILLSIAGSLPELAITVSAAASGDFGLAADPHLRAGVGRHFGGRVLLERSGNQLADTGA